MDSAQNEDSRAGQESSIAQRPTDKLDKKRMEGRANRDQGTIGEGISLRIASEKLGLMIADPRFDQKSHGFDAVFLDKGKPVVIESKFAKAGKGSLEGDQGQPAWVRRIASDMQNQNSNLYSQGNAEIGRDILKVGPENVRRILITIDQSTLTANVYEGQNDLSWKKIVSNYSVYDLDQPYLK